MSAQEVADIVVLETRLRLFSLGPLEPENGASLRRRILCPPIEEPELLW